MITLIVQENGKEKRVSFSKRTILIGPDDPTIDIVLNENGLSTPHVKIEETNGKYIITNVAHDPEVLLNDLHFGVRTLQKNNTLTIKGSFLTIIEIDDVVVESIQSKTQESTFESDVIKQDDLNVDKEVEKLFKEVESLHIFEQEPAVENEEPLSPKIKIKKRWFALLLSLVFSALIVFLSVTYLKVNIKSEEEELHAAKGVSDAAAALLFAKIHSINPQNSNWSDPMLFHQILSQLIPQRTQTFYDINAEGKFAQIPYILRVYTNENASRFVLIAQPEPSVIHWFSPKDSIVIESDTMELRRLQDIQPMNRLLFNSPELTPSVLKRISLLAQEGALITTKKLGLSDPNSLFNPPEELQIIAPGAQNLIYNSPRYFKITDPIVKEALQGRSDEGFISDLKKLSDLQHLVFYTNEGIRTATLAYKALSSLLNQKSLLIGYFTFDPHTHLPLKTKLLVKDDKLKFTNTNSPLIEQPFVDNSLSSETPSIDIQSNLYKKMVGLSTQRKRTLEAISLKIAELLNQQNNQPSKSFTSRLIAYLEEYEENDLKQQKEITNSLKKLYREENSVFTNDQFFSYIKATGLSSYVKRKKKNPEENLLKSATGKANREEESQKIDPILD